MLRLGQTGLLACLEDACVEERLACSGWRSHQVQGSRAASEAVAVGAWEVVAAMTVHQLAPPDSLSG